MLASLAVTVSIPGEWLVILPVAATILVYVWGRRAAQSSTVTKSEVLTDKSVDNIKDLWDKRDDLKKEVADLRERQAYIEGVHVGKGCMTPRPPAE